VPWDGLSAAEKGKDRSVVEGILEILAEAELQIVRTRHPPAAPASTAAGPAPPSAAAQTAAAGPAQPTGAVDA
jgi:hypothetical protein